MLCMNTTEALAAQESKTRVTADYVSLTFTGTIASVSLTGADVLIDTEDGFAQWVPTHLVTVADQWTP